MPVTVTPVRTWSDLRAFVHLPERLHAGTPWVPPLRLERYAFLSRRLNAYFSHGRAQYFLARCDGRVVGRVTAQVDDAYNAYHESRWGMFGFLELEDDPEILPALLAAAEGWLRARGCDRMVGPMDFSLNDESGVLIEGHEREPLIRQPWQPPYYQARCEEAGLEKAMDLFSYELSLDDRATMHRALERAAERARTRYGVRLRRMTRRSLRRDLDAFADVYNSAWSRNWGFVPYGEADLDAYALDLQLVYHPEWFMVAELDGEVVGASISVIDINQVLRRMNGRLLPFGWWYFVRRHHIVDRVRVGFLGAKPESWHTGAAAALYVEQFAAAARSPFKYGEAGWILEINHGMTRALEAMNGRIVKRYRVYERSL